MSSITKPPKSEYQEENIQTLLTWARLPLDAPSHYRPLVFHTVRGGFERAVAYTHAEITKFTERVNTNEDVVTFTLLIKQKRDKFAGVLFGRVPEETYQKALANLNAWVPKHWLGADVVQRVAGVAYAPGNAVYMSIFYSNDKEVTRTECDSSFKTYTSSDGTVKDWDYYFNMGYRIINRITDTAMKEKGLIWKRYVPGTTYIIRDCRRTLGYVQVKKDGKVSKTFAGYMEGGKCIVIEPKALFEELGYTTTEGTGSYTIKHKTNNELPAISISKYVFGSKTSTNVVARTVNDSVKAQLGNGDIGWDNNTKTAIISFNTPKTNTGKNYEYIPITQTVTGGKTVKLHMIKTHADNITFKNRNGASGIPENEYGINGGYFTLRGPNEKGEIIKGTLNICVKDDEYLIPNQIHNSGRLNCNGTNPTGTIIYTGKKMECRIVNDYRIEIANNQYGADKVNCKWGFC